MLAKLGFPYWKNMFGESIVYWNWPFCWLDTHLQIQLDPFGNQLDPRNISWLSLHLTGRLTSPTTIDFVFTTGFATANALLLLELLVYNTCLCRKTAPSQLSMVGITSPNDTFVLFTYYHCYPSLLVVPPLPVELLPLLWLYPTTYNQQFTTLLLTFLNY